MVAEGGRAKARQAAGNSRYSGRIPSLTETVAAAVTAPLTILRALVELPNLLERLSDQLARIAESEPAPRRGERLGAFFRRGQREAGDTA